MIRYPVVSGREPGFANIVKKEISSWLGRFSGTSNEGGVLREGDTTLPGQHRANTPHSAVEDDGTDVGNKKGILDTSLLHQTEPSLRPRWKEGMSCTVSYQDLD